jgi:hypothetical protein
VTISAGSNVSVSGDQNVSLTALGKDVVVASFCNVYVSASNMVDMTTLGGINLSATNKDVTITSVNSNLILSAQSSETLALSNYGIWGIAPSNVSFHSGSNVSIVADDSFLLTGSNSSTIASSNNLTISAGQVLTLQASSLDASGFENLAWSANSNIDFRILQSESPNDPVISITSNQETIRGNIVVTGEINTNNVLNTTVVQQTLKVADKTIQLANVGTGSNSDWLPTDGFLTNDQSGLVVDGFPSVFNSNAPSAYEKSIKWNYGDAGNQTEGVLALGTADIEKEAYWELNGGSFRLTHKKINLDNSTTDISFGFRINQHDELELVKKYWDDNTSSYVYKRVARFGRQIL